MRHLKTLALAAVAAGALMAFVGAGTASATELCSTTASPCPAGQKVDGKLSFSLVAGTKFVMKETGAPEGEGGTLGECSTMESEDEITNNGSSTTTVTATMTRLHLTNCTFPITTTELGKVEIHRIAGTSNGTVTSGMPTRVTFNTILFGTCIYTVEAAKSTGDLTEGNPAIVHLNAVAHKQSGSNFVCPTTTLWTATLQMTSPKTTVSVS